jgi:outer membrane protein FlgP
MKKIVLLTVAVASYLFAATPATQTESVKENVVVEEKNVVLNNNNVITLSVIGQGVSPEHTISNYQALALAKKAAIADAYRMLAEKINGVKVEGYDIVKNMVIQRSQVKTCVSSMIRHANIVETKCAKDFCEVEMELKVVGNKWYPELASAYK